MENTVFSWVVEEASGIRQVAARIVVKTATEVAADTGWEPLDSLAARVDVSLRPATRYYWTVSVRTDAGEEAVSEENWFETGIHDWSAKWIGCDNEQQRHPVFSKEIRPVKPVASARLYICGLGLYETSWNGEKLGTEYLTPYCNNYNAWVQYQTYDITEPVRCGGTLAVTLGNGWYNGRFGFERNPKPFYGDGLKLIAQVELTYVDGIKEIVGTDESWTVTRSNIVFSNIYDGEHRDDTLPDISPVNALIVAPPKGELTARYSTPVAVRMELPIKEIIRTPTGETVIDMGQNMTGFFRLTVHEPFGTRIRLQFGEILQNGNFYRDNLRTAKAEYVYISDGQPHVLNPKFTFYGFRYVKIEGISELNPEDFTALVLHSELPKAGSLKTGNALVNQLISNIEWGQIGNFLDVPTDCPQRDERMGWTGDAQVFAPTACYQRNSYLFLKKYLHDMWTEQQGNDGAVPDVVPGFGKKTCAAAWGDAACIIPWTLYEFYGDKTILEEQYASMTAWVDYISRVDGENNGWRQQFHYGDWLALDSPTEDDRQGGTDIGLIASTQYRHCAMLAAKAAHILGKTEDAKRYTHLADVILEKIREEFYSPNGRCTVPTQTGYLLSIKYGLSVDRGRTGNDLIQKLKQDGGMLKTGFVGTPLLCPVLTDIGQANMAFDLLLNEGYPGWLYAVKMGATTVWERWNSVMPDGTISGTGMNSLNHYAYGSIAQWLYRNVAGIAPAEPGFRKAKLKPSFHDKLGKMSAVYDSAAGRWETYWEILPDGTVFYRCEVPFGCSAELELPYGGGVYALNPGVFQKTYLPNEPLHTVLGAGTPIRDLLCNPKARTVLLKIIPEIVNMPVRMRGYSMREFAAYSGSDIKQDFLDQIDSLLAIL